MDVRQKLVELLCVSPYLDVVKGYEGNDCTFEQGADWLIARGVTVQEWISVKDRLPDKGVLVLVSDGSDYPEAAELVLMDSGRLIWQDGNFREVKHITHWMPLPEPPKGE